MGLALRNIRHSYGAAVVVDGASIEAAPGEIVCLLGPSGCGKTTLLRIAAGLERLHEGSVELNGATLATPHLHTPPERRPIGFVFQDYVLFPHLSVARNVAFGLADLAVADRTKRVDEELAAVDLSQFADRYPHQLSGGQQQRAALARAFARRPSAMLLDEPFASVDVALSRRLRSDLRRLLKARSTPAILVTHDPIEAIEIGDRIAVMRQGRIMETASPEILFRTPKTVAGASLFAGSQTLGCRPSGIGVDTAFGPIAPLHRPDDAAFVVIHDGGVAASEDVMGACRVIDCRFNGPDWLATLVGSDGASVIRARCRVPIDVGATASISFEVDKARALAS